jgi:hypothetical protein
MAPPRRSGDSEDESANVETEQNLSGRTHDKNVEGDPGDEFDPVFDLRPKEDDDLEYVEQFWKQFYPTDEHLLRLRWLFFFYLRFPPKQGDRGKVYEQAERFLSLFPSPILIIPLSDRGPAIEIPLIYALESERADKNTLGKAVRKLESIFLQVLRQSSRRRYQISQQTTR